MGPAAGTRRGLFFFSQEKVLGKDIPPSPRSENGAETAVFLQKNAGGQYDRPQERDPDYRPHRVGEGFSGGAD